MTFGQHPSQAMRALFQQRPYQGQDPANARIVFLGSDANYSADISEHAFFRRILEYHHDGVRFWQTYGVHHPFLLPEYPFDRRKGGVRYHRNFSKLGLNASHAPHISFLELLDIPTIGMKSRSKAAFFDLVSPLHLAYIDRLIGNDQKKLILASTGVLEDMHQLKRRYGTFKWLAEDRIGPYLEQHVAGSEIRACYHFSSTEFDASMPSLKDHINRWLCSTNYSATNPSITEGN